MSSNEKMNRFTVSGLIKRDNLTFIQIPDLILKALYSQDLFPYRSQLVCVYVDLFRQGRSYDNKRFWAMDLGMSPVTLNRCLAKLSSMELLTMKRIYGNVSIELELTFPTGFREHPGVFCPLPGCAESPASDSEILPDDSKTPLGDSEIPTSDLGGLEPLFSGEFASALITPKESCKNQQQQDEKVVVFPDENVEDEDEDPWADGKEINFEDDGETIIKEDSDYTVECQNGNSWVYLTKADLRDYCYWNNSLRKGRLDSQMIKNRSGWIVSVMNGSVLFDATEYMIYKRKKKAMEDRAIKEVEKEKKQDKADREEEKKYNVGISKMALIKQAGESQLKRITRKYQKEEYLNHREFLDARKSSSEESYFRHLNGFVEARIRREILLDMLPEK